jgi:hypothetical protein
MGVAPAVVAGVGLAISAAATATTIALQQKAQRQAADFQDQQSKNNATLAGHQRADIMRRAKEQESGIINEGRRINASAVAAITAGGLDPSVGTPANLLATSAYSAALDASRIRASAIRAAWGLENEEQQHTSQAEQARRAGVLGVIGTGISGVGQLGSQIGSGAASIIQSQSQMSSPFSRYR